MQKFEPAQEIRLAVFDLDGTLIKTGEDLVYPAVQDAIRAAIAKGTIVSIATGRPYSFTRSIALKLGLTAPLICYQGAIIQTMGGHILRSIYFSGQTLAPALELARQRQWQYYLEGDGVNYMEQGLRYNERLFTIHPQPKRFVPDLGDPSIRTNQFSIFLPDTIEAGHLSELENVLGPAAIVMRTEAHFINVIPAGVSKGDAVAWLANSLDIPQSAVMAVGDSFNDVSMIQWAGVGVAMGGAQQEVKSKADWVAPPFGEQGAAAALHRFVLDGD